MWSMTDDEITGGKHNSSTEKGITSAIVEQRSVFTANGDVFVLGDEVRMLQMHPRLNPLVPPRTIPCDI